MKRRRGTGRYRLRRRTISGGMRSRTSWSGGKSCLSGSYSDCLLLRQLCSSCPFQRFLFGPLPILLSLEHCSSLSLLLSLGGFSFATSLELRETLLLLDPSFLSFLLSDSFLLSLLFCQSFAFSLLNSKPFFLLFPLALFGFPFSLLALALGSVFPFLLLPSSFFLPLALFLLAFLLLSSLALSFLLCSTLDRLATSFLLLCLALTFALFCFVL